LKGVEADFYWRAVRWLALEHLRLREDESGIQADALIVGSFDGTPLRLQYEVRCDHSWRTTAVAVTDLSRDEQIVLTRQVDACWRDASGADQLELATAIDVDIAATPFTNTLPIRRLSLGVGEAREITVAYVAVTPNLSFRPIRQRYTRLPADGKAGRYLYESLESDFNRELITDADGLVVDYPGIWQRG
jgi:hypothetical protein